MTCCVLFFSASLGLLFNRKHLVINLIAIEVMLIAVVLNFFIFSSFSEDLLGQIMSVLILTVAGVESAIGLALLLCYYRLKGTISINFLNILKG